MFRKKFFLVLCLFSLFVFSSFTESLRDLFFLTQDGTRIYGSGTYFIRDKPFEINIAKNMSAQNIPTRIFLYHTDKMFTLELPVSIENTPMFASGTGLARERSPEIELYVNREYSHNHLTEADYKSSEKNTVIPIAKISGLTQRVPLKLYVTLFTDFNKNKIIETGEVVNFILNIDRQTAGTLLAD